MSAPARSAFIGPACPPGANTGGKARLVGRGPVRRAGAGPRQGGSLHTALQTDDLLERQGFIESRPRLESFP
ncbi:hypothetical protein [Hymenobacter sp. GOD-10R]|uniref:hypothetical protein n=1 Tax=Hymenobacter sp. GOD-10R TaxID=3093922 RepID=UPI002D78DFA6|nr:hypothetical protein [Hymenobacter sp. GOD-10R]WRQ31854.1 hypothetical protein SD425_29360 [Hymenobacter sp. GOD-10R]